jgi:hypothetical protein
MKKHLMSSMKSHRRWGMLISAACLSALTLVSSAKEEWLSLIPENAVAVITIKDTAELVADWDKSSLGRFMEDPDVLKWIEPLFEGGEAPWDKGMKGLTGKGLREELAIYHGATVMALMWPNMEAGQTNPGLVSLSEVGDKAAELEASKIKQFEIKLAEDEDLKELTLEIEGLTIRYLAASEDEDEVWADSWVIVDDVMVEGSDRAAVEHVVVGLQKGAASAPAALLANFNRFGEISGGQSDLVLYIDAEILLAKMTEMMGAMGGGADAGNPFTPELFMGALSLDEIRGFGLAINLEDELSAMDVALLHKEKAQGLIVNLLRGADSKVDLPGFIPAGIPSATVTRWSFLGFYDQLMAALNKLGPMFGGMVQMQLGQFEQQVGMKLRDDLFATTDDTIIQVGDFSKATGLPTQVMGVKLKDAARFNAAFEALKGLVGNGFGIFEETEFAGYKVWKVKPNQAVDQPDAPAQEMAYSLAKDYLFFASGSVETLHKVLNRLSDPSGPSLWDDAAVKEAIAALPANYTSVGVTDGSAMIKNSIKAIASAQKSMLGLGGKEKGKGKGKGKGNGAADQEAIEKLFDADAMPGDEVFQRYFGVASSGSYSLEDASHYRMVAKPVEAQ